MIGETMEYIHNARNFGGILSLKSIAGLLNHMGNPQKKLKYVHVTGTNGKGSVIAFLSRILMEAGYKTGVFTSPYIQCFSEEIKIDGKEITSSEIVACMETVKSAADEMQKAGEQGPTEFELVIAMALLHFLREKCDIVILEVGMGGRLDATNVIDFPEAAVITTVSYDHMNILGDTLGKIAFEKAGIIKDKCNVALCPQKPEADAVIKRVCQMRNAKLYPLNLSQIVRHSFDLSGQAFDFDKYKDLKIHLLGDYQTVNAALAVRAAEALKDRGFSIREKDIRKGLENARWPGRLEIICRDPFLLIGGSHNVQGVQSLSDNLKEYFPGRKFTFITGVLADKEYKKMMDLIAPLAQRFVTVTPKNSRALDSGILAGVLKKYGVKVTDCKNTARALEFCRETAEPGDFFCAFGSLYFIGQIREAYHL